MKKAASAVVAVATAAIALTACSSTTATSGSGSSSRPESKAAKSATERLERVIAGTFAKPAATPITPQTAGTKVWVISCAQAAEGCAAAVSGVKEAGDELNWDVTIFDGKFDPNVWNRGIRQAVSAGAKAIVLANIDCSPVRQSLVEARKAGVKIYGFYNFDCDDPSVGGAPLFDRRTDYGAPYGTDYGKFLEAYGRTNADWVISHTKGNAKVLDFEIGGYLFQSYISKGFKDQLKTECPDCSIEASVPFLGTDLGPALTAKVQAALLKEPKANVVAVHIDSGMQSAAPAILQARRSGRSLLSQGGEGLKANFDLIRDDKGQDMLNAGSPTWLGWAAVDGVNRLLAGQSPVSSGQGFQIVDRKNNLPAQGEPYSTGVDFKSAYRAAWGIG